jgi:hypothetical protein
MFSDDGRCWPRQATAAGPSSGAGRRRRCPGPCSTRRRRSTSVVGRSLGGPADSAAPVLPRTVVIWARTWAHQAAAQAPGKGERGEPVPMWSRLTVRLAHIELCDPGAPKALVAGSAKARRCLMMFGDVWRCEGRMFLFRS